MFPKKILCVCRCTSQSQLQKEREQMGKRVWIKVKKKLTLKVASTLGDPVANVTIVAEGNKQSGHGHWSHYHYYQQRYALFPSVLIFLYLHFPPKKKKKSLSLSYFLVYTIKRPQNTTIQCKGQSSVKKSVKADFFLKLGKCRSLSLSLSLSLILLFYGGENSVV